MRKTIVTLTDDTDGSKAAESVTFAIDGQNYEIDLSEPNARTLRKTLAQYITAARRTQARPARRIRSAATHAATEAIREWAASAGIAVAPRGRIPGAVTDAYRAAMRAARVTPEPAPDGSQSPAEPVTEPPAGNGHDSVDNAAVRTWAAQNGYDVKPRGRIPADVVIAYRQARG